MMALAAGTLTAGGHPSLPVGAAAFYLSDLTVAATALSPPAS